MSERLALQTRGLSKQYRVGHLIPSYRPALVDLDLDVRDGEILGYVGPNGSGKTTTLKLLMGLLRPDRGEVSVLSRPHAERSWRFEVGYLPEHPYLYDYLTPAEYLDYVGRLFALPAPRRRERTRELLALVGLERSTRVPMRRFSKGMVQRVGLAQALVNDPKLLILDEPMSGLDPIGRKEVRDLMLRQRAKGRTLFFSTHILPDVEMVCDRVGILVGGRLVRSGSMRSLLGEDLESIEVTATGIPAETLAAVERLALAPPLVQDDRVMVRLPGEAELEIALFMLVGAKSRVLSVVPQRRSLESIFLEASREARS
jgi:ABC-2 type transport system ATP-binding protein